MDKFSCKNTIPKLVEDARIWSALRPWWSLALTGPALASNSRVLSAASKFRRRLLDACACANWRARRWRAVSPPPASFTAAGQPYLRSSSTRLNTISAELPLKIARCKAFSPRGDRTPGSHPFANNKLQTIQAITRFLSFIDTLYTG